MCSCCDQTTEDAGCCSLSLKTMVYLLNAICWAAGGFLVYVGVEFMLSAGSLNELSLKPPIIIFSTASVILIGGVVGCYGVYSQKKACLSIYLVFVTTVLIIMSAVTGIMLASPQAAHDSFNEMIETSFSKYSNKTQPEVSVVGDEMSFNATQFIDQVQTNLHCCGYHNYTDWATYWNNTHFVPVSCCDTTKTGNLTCTGDLTQLDLIYAQGCEVPLNETFTSLYKLFEWSCFGMAVLSLIALIAVIVFLCTDRTTAYYYSTLSPGYTEA